MNIKRVISAVLVLFVGASVVTLLVRGTGEESRAVDHGVQSRPGMLSGTSPEIGPHRVRRDEGRASPARYRCTRLRAKRRLEHRPEDRLGALEAGGADIRQVVRHDVQVP